MVLDHKTKKNKLGNVEQKNWTLVFSAEQFCETFNTIHYSEQKKTSMVERNRLNDVKLTHFEFKEWDQTVSKIKLLILLTKRTPLFCVQRKNLRKSYKILIWIYFLTQARRIIDDRSSLTLLKMSKCHEWRTKLIWFCCQYLKIILIFRKRWR